MQLERKFPKENLRKMGMRISGDCPFCDSYLEDIDHFIQTMYFCYNDLCPTPNGHIHFLDWIDLSLKDGNVHHKIYGPFGLTEIK